MRVVNFVKELKDALLKSSAYCLFFLKTGFATRFIRFAFKGVKRSFQDVAV